MSTISSIPAVNIPVRNNIFLYVRSY
uniref:Uncharacterized protein n=1 Tax=Anguilla anguilla TaxID=7936 RepID=A0A0E9WIN9_ANGAN